VWEFEKQVNGDDPRTRMVHLVREIALGLNHFGSAFGKENGLHATDLRALIRLLDASRAGITATPGWLGEQLGLNSASVTALLDRLERLGHVSRVRDTADRRRVLLVVESQAVALGWSFFGPLITEMVAAMGEFDDAEIATVQRFLLRMNEAILSVGDTSTTAETPQ
jgi:DNA-binding MarR family transcriptional regulator